MSYELKQTTILEAEIDVLREQLTRAKEENKDLRAKFEKANTTLRSVLEGYRIIEEYVCLLIGNSCDENETITHANSIVQIALNDELNN